MLVTSHKQVESGNYKVFHGTYKGHPCVIKKIASRNSCVRHKGFSNEWVNHDKTVYLKHTIKTIYRERFSERTEDISNELCITYDELFVFPKLKGCDLFSWVSDKHDYMYIYHIFCKIICAVNELDSIGLAHGDLKDENIWVHPNLNVTLLDLMCVHPKDEVLTKNCGTSYWNPPHHPCCTVYQSQMWMLGMIMYEFLYKLFPDEEDKDSRVAKLMDEKYHDDIASRNRETSDIYSWWKPPMLGCLCIVNQWTLNEINDYLKTHPYPKANL